jgi:hypothetical protein
MNTLKIKYQDHQYPSLRSVKNINALTYNFSLTNLDDFIPELAEDHIKTWKSPDRLGLRDCTKGQRARICLHAS